MTATPMTRHYSQACNAKRHPMCPYPDVVCECSCHDRALAAAGRRLRSTAPKPKGRARTTRVPLAPWPDLPTKEQAACCQSRLDALGRPPIGFCSPEGVRRRPVR